MKRRSRVTSRGWARRPTPLSLLALLGLTLALVALLALGLAGLGSQWGWWHFRTGFSMIRWAAYGGLLAAVVSLLGAVHTWPGSARRGFSAAVIGLVLGVSAFAVPWQWQRVGRSVPPIADITTDTENPPQFVAILPLRADAPNPSEYAGGEIAAQQRAAYPDIRPVRLELPPELAFTRALNTARALGWEIVAADAAERRIEASDRTFWFGFVDDVVIRVTPAAAGGSRVDARSASRVGRGDMGTNARRLRRYFERLTSN